jgi:hypothetical protein
MGTEAMPFYAWPVLLAGGVLFFLVVELEKYIVRMRQASRRAATAA